MQQIRENQRANIKEETRIRISSSRNRESADQCQTGNKQNKGRMITLCVHQRVSLSINYNWEQEALHYDSMKDYNERPNTVIGNR